MFLFFPTSSFACLGFVSLYPGTELSGRVVPPFLLIDARWYLPSQCWSIQALFCGLWRPSEFPSSVIAIISSRVKFFSLMERWNCSSWSHLCSTVVIHGQLWFCSPTRMSGWLCFGPLFCLLLALIELLCVLEVSNKNRMVRETFYDVLGPLVSLIGCCTLCCGWLVAKLAVKILQGVIVTTIFA